MLELLNGESALWVLFTTGFLSATLLPGGSEANLIASLKLGDNAAWLVVFVATLGNTLGGMTNYWLGRLLPDKTSDEKHGHKALQWLKKYGYWSLFFSWLPVIGDPLCLAAGWLRMHHWLSLLIIMIGKAARYAVLALIVQGLL
ncbi:YqaA family protein [Photobacterium chitinilyticum]|uniref:DedA family protein n=1 Tax=Photobacterium chitinilyticum TaxID=2485123 RepID=A0A3S3UI06_9GAMM|nr:YqaA family protein [Photobacterium chitinilyticum]RWX52918.1 DedA family protein [Photobacterium chitinilyticum]